MSSLEGYSKWDSLQDSDEEDESEQTDELKQLQHWRALKQVADELFSRGRLERSAEGYREVLQELQESREMQRRREGERKELNEGQEKEKNELQKTGEQLHRRERKEEELQVKQAAKRGISWGLPHEELRVLCLLNLSCCFLKMEEWTLCVRTCDDLLATAAEWSYSSLSRSQILSPEKHARCLYFKAFSLLESLRGTDCEFSMENVEVALKCCYSVQNIISETSNFADISLSGEVSPLLTRIQDFKDKIRCEDSLSITQTPTLSSSGEDSSSREMTSLLHEGQRLLTVNQPMAAIKVYKKCVSIMKRRVSDNTNCVLDGRIVTCYQRIGDCYAALQEYDEAISTYEMACGHIDVDSDIIASYSNPEECAMDEDLLLPPMVRARTLYLKAGDCAYRSSSFNGAKLTPESDVSRALQYYQTSLSGLPQSKHDRESYFINEGMDSTTKLMALRLESSALQGVYKCYFQQKKYEDAISQSKLALDIMNDIIESDALFNEHNEDNATDTDNEKIEIVWRKQMVSFEIMSFSQFYLSRCEEALSTLNQAFKFSEEYVKQYSKYSKTSISSREAFVGKSKASVDEQKLRPLRRNDILLKLLLFKNQVMLQLSIYDADELNNVWDSIAECGNAFAIHEEHIEAGKVYKLAAEYYMSQSGRSAFALNDKSSNQESTPSSQRANELNALAAKYTKKHTYHLLSQLKSETHRLTTEQSDKLILTIHKQFISCIRVLFLQGICAENVTFAQRHFESAHSMREEYDRAKGDPKNLLTPLQDLSILEECEFLFGDISHHLAFVYMKSGKLLYALEEIQSALKAYEGVHDKYTSFSIDKNSHSKDEDTQTVVLQHLQNSTRSLYPNEGKGQRGMPGVVFRLRHAWGLMAVIRCERREQDLSTEALKKVQDLQPAGPIVEEDATKELERLTNIISVRTNASKSKPLSSGSSSQSSVLQQNWSKARSESFRKKPAFTPPSSVQKAAPPADAEPVDGNLMFAYFVLTCTVTAVIYVLGVVYFT